MKTIVVVASLEYDDSLMHAEDWFINEVLKGPAGLVVYSEDIGDTVAKMQVMQIVFPVQPRKRTDDGD